VNIVLPKALNGSTDLTDIAEPETGCAVAGLDSADGLVGHKSFEK
jgi:hypothetical protein